MDSKKGAIAFGKYPLYMGGVSADPHPAAYLYLQASRKFKYGLVGRPSRPGSCLYGAYE